MKIISLVFVLIGILGVWLVYWNITDFMVTGIDTGIWDWSILEKGMTSISVGIILLLIFMYKGIKVIK